MLRSRVARTSGYLWIVGSLIAGCLLAMGHRGVALCIVPAILFILWLARSNPSGLALVAFVLGATESLSLIELWSISPTAGFLSICVFGTYRALSLTALAWLYRRGVSSPWMMGSAWAFFEALHALVPLSVPNVVGECLIDTPLDVFITGFGALGVSAVVVSLGAMLVSRSRRLMPGLVIGSLFLGMVAGFGGQQDSSMSPGPSLSATEVLMVRGGLRLDEYSKVDGLERYRTLTDAPHGTKIGLIIWPETATGAVWNRDQDFMRVVQEYGYKVPLLLGATRIEEDGRPYNGALFSDPSGVQILDKARRVWPIEQSYAAGSSTQFIQTPLGRFRVLICADILNPFSTLLTTSTKPEGLIILADATRFTGTELAQMHVRRARIRAMEAGTPALFVEQSERLAVIDSRGEVIEESVMAFEPGTLSTTFPRASKAKPDFYWIVVWGLFLAGAFAEERWMRRMR